MSGIRVSEKHGVNPSLDLCFYCGEPKGVILFGRMKGDAQAPREAVMDREPCAKCKEYMKAGVILIEVRDGEEGSDPYRTGRYAVVRDEAITRMVRPPKHAADILKRRVAFVPHEAWLAMGLPTETTEKKDDNS